MRGRQRCTKRFFAAGKHPLEIAREEGLERLLLFPFRMLRRERFDAVESERELEIHRLLGPQRAVVVEHGDAFRLGHKLLAARRGYTLHEVHNGAFGCTVSPRR